MPADERLAGHALRLVEHVHLLRGDHELRRGGSSRANSAPTSPRTYSTAEVVEEPHRRRVVEMALRVEVGGVGLDVDHEPVAVGAQRVRAGATAASLKPT